MNTGMLWFDNDPKKPLNEKIIKAVAYSSEKYGVVPNLCFVNPAQLDEPKDIGGIEIRPFKPILLHHFWLGHKSQEG